MVGYIRDGFCELDRHSFRFGPISSVVPWRDQYQNAERIAPEPTDFRAFLLERSDVRPTRMPDFLRSGSTAIVSDAFRQIVLSLEPEKHQFVPIALFDEARELLPGRYWVLNVLQRFDCVIEPEEIMRWHAEGDPLPEMDGFWRTRPNGSRAPSGKVVYVDKTKIVGRHLWRPLWHIKILNDVRFDLFFSEELLQRVAQAKLWKLTIRPVIEISVPQSR